jgi:myosin phosphatase Rho-interacting protein
MESSHKRIISDLEVKHKGEIQRLLNEKETALAEETQVSRKSFTIQESCT